MSNPQHDLFVTFYSEAVEMKAESQKEGRPIFKDIPHIRIAIPGDKNNLIERKVYEDDKKRFPVEWARFLAQESTGQVGMPLEQWPQITRAQVKEAKYFEVHTVEQLASLSDSNCMRMGMGFQELREKAKKYLAISDQSQDLEEKKKMQSEIELLKSQLAELLPKRGRPKQEEAKTE